MLKFSCEMFIFTHGPIVGHGGGATHDTITPGMGGAPADVVDRDIPFVEWVNGAGMTVEAVFVGHTHEEFILYYDDAYCTEKYRR